MLKEVNIEHLKGGSQIIIEIYSYRKCKQDEKKGVKISKSKTTQAKYANKIRYPETIKVMKRQLSGQFFFLYIDQQKNYQIHFLLFKSAFKTIKTKNICHHKDLI